MERRGLKVGWEYSSWQKGWNHTHTHQNLSVSHVRRSWLFTFEILMSPIPNLSSFKIFVYDVREIKMDYIFLESGKHHLVDPASKGA